MYPLFPYFSSYFPACYLIILCFQQVLLLSSDLACLQSPGRSGTFQNCLFWNYWGYSILCFTACVQLVGVSTVFVFLGKGLLVQDTNQGDHYLYEICPFEHSEQICHQIAISFVSSSPSHCTVCLSWNLLICCIYLEEAC